MKNMFAPNARGLINFKHAVHDGPMKAKRFGTLRARKASRHSWKRED